jgi:hypothetical protein
MKQSVRKLINTNKYPDLLDSQFISKCRGNYFKNGFCHLPNFLNQEMIQKLQKESKESLLIEQNTFRSTETYSPYLVSKNKLPETFQNIQEKSTKVVVPADKIPESSDISKLYFSSLLKQFINEIVTENSPKPLYHSKDHLGCFYFNFFFHGDSLGYHFDNSEFFVNILIQKSDYGGNLEYFLNSRSEENQNFENTLKILNGEIKDAKTMNLEEGDLLVFRGRYSLHRVTPVVGLKPRINVIMTFEREEDKKLTDYTRLKFFGRI